MKFGLEQLIIDKLIAVFEQYSKVDKAFVFGSRAKGNYRPDSDIDIAIKGQDLNTDYIIAMSVAFEEKGITHKLDLLRYETIKEPDLKDHIDRVGIELYSGWKEYRLEEIATIQTGPFGSQLHMSDYKISGTPIITVEHLGENRILHNNLPLVSNEDKQRLIKYTLKEGDIVFSRVGSVDRRAYVSDEEDGWMFSGRLLRVRVNKDKVCPKFLSFYFGQESFKETVRRIAVGATMPSINTTILSEIEVVIPQKKEQTAIASILSSLDDKIDLLNRQNKTLEQLAETLFRQWFVEEAEESWEEKSLTDIADYLNGLALQKFPAKIDYLPVIKIREMKQGVSENTDRCSRDIPTQYIIQDGDVLFSWSGSLEVVLWTGGEGALNQHLFKVSSKAYPKWFYYLATKHHLAEFKVIAESKSTTMGHIQREHLKQAMISIPPKELFNQYDERIAPMICKLVDNNKQIRTLTQTRDALLPKLMSGEVRVNL
jgi:type I restriction enzyme S subunit